VLCLGYRGGMIKEYFLNYRAMNEDFTLCLGNPSQAIFHGRVEEHDFRVTLADTGEETLTGGRLKRVARYLEGEERFMVTYGDGVSDVDISALLDFHGGHGKLATVTTFRPTSRFGILSTNEAARVESFREKPPADAWASAGFFVFERKVLDYLGSDDISLESKPLEKLAADGELMAYRHQGFFYAMDTYREYQLLNQTWNSGNAPWKKWA
jgi:glucose-1-phosphate cytidylyltransferase